jgi:hypothetical protein
VEQFILHKVHITDKEVTDHYRLVVSDTDDESIAVNNESTALVDESMAVNDVSPITGTI